jgi:hypothetical protein
MSFLRHRETIAWLSKQPDGKLLIVSSPSGHAMSSSQLFLRGLLSSRARLRFAGVSIIVDPKHFTLQVDLCILGSDRARPCGETGSHFMLWPAHCSWDRTRSGAVEGCKRG